MYSNVLIGRLVNNPELRHTSNGNPVLNVRIAEERKTRNGRDGTRLVWHTLTAWGDTAKSISQYIRMGTLVCIRFRIDYQAATIMNHVNQPTETFIPSFCILAIDVLSDATARNPTQSQAVPA